MPGSGFTLVLPFTKPPMTMNELRRKPHWTAQRRAHDDASLAVQWLCRQQKLSLIEERVVVTLTWFAKGATRRDPDSLGVFVKGAIDGLTTAKVLADDSGDHIDEVRTRVRTRATNPRIEMIVEVSHP